MLSPLQLYDYRQTLLASLIFTSNILFSIRLDYFEGISAETRPLLHTWSLGVEEQFYLILPLLMIACWRLLRSRIHWLLIALWLISFVSSIAITAIASDIAFYHLPFRMWELLTGSLLAAIPPPHAPSRRLAWIMGATGALLIAAAVIFFSPDLTFPGVSALAPVLGATLILRAGQHGAHPVGDAISTPLVVGVGLISYSLYLWHWPPIVLGQLYLMRPLTEVERILIFFLAIAIAWLSWRFVELPFRDRSRFSRVRIFALAAVMLALFSVIALPGISGPPDRSAASAALHLGATAAIRRDSCHLDVGQTLTSWGGLARCSAGAGRYRILLWGDSHAAHLMPGIREMTERGADLYVVQVSRSSCPPALDFSNGVRPGCAAFNAGVAAMATRLRFDHVILAGAWEDYHLTEPMEAIQATINHLRRAGSSVTLVLQSPRFYFDDPALFEARYGGIIAISKPRTRISDRLGELSSVAFFDPQAAICQGLLCPVRDGVDYYFFDGHHLSVNGSRVMACALFRSHPALRRFRRCDRTSGQDTRIEDAREEIEDGGRPRKGRFSL